MTHIVPPIQGIEGSWADLYKVTCDGPAAQYGRLPPVGGAADQCRSIMRCVVLLAESVVITSAGELEWTSQQRYPVEGIVDLILRVNEGKGIDVSEMAEQMHQCGRSNGRAEEIVGAGGGRRAMTLLIWIKSCAGGKDQ